MKLAMVGSRHYSVPELVEENIRQAFGRYGTDLVVVTGDCPSGADALVRSICARRSIACTVHRADWNTFGRRAGPLRNSALVDSLDDNSILLAFLVSTAENRGSRDTMGKAHARGLRVYIVDEDGRRRRRRPED